MIDIFVNTLPFFALIGLGYGSARVGLFSRDATSHLTRFVFYFALSAMLFQFSSTLDLDDVLEWEFMAAYALGSLVLWGITLIIANARGEPFEIAIIEAHGSVIGNMGWMGLAMLPILFGSESIRYVMMVLIVDLVFFGPLIVIVLLTHREGRFHVGLFQTVGLGLIQNPLVLSISTGLMWAALAIPVPDVLNRFMTILGGASTPGALFAIGASMAFAARGTRVIPAYLAANKLLWHPVCVAITGMVIFNLDPYAVAVMIACAAMPVAGNVYMIAHHYQIPADRISGAILISTAVSIATISATVAWVRQLYL